LNAHRQMIHALLVQRRERSVRVPESWMMPRLPVNVPRAEVATISPNGVTLFRRAICPCDTGERLEPVWVFGNCGLKHLPGGGP
jgi:hypothetical protein